MSESATHAIDKDNEYIKNGENDQQEKSRNDVNEQRPERLHCVTNAWNDEMYNSPTVLEENVANTA
jgi:hypothetical protein